MRAILRAGETTLRISSIDRSKMHCKASRVLTPVKLFQVRVFQIASARGKTLRGAVMSGTEIAVADGDIDVALWARAAAMSSSRSGEQANPASR